LFGQIVLQQSQVDAAADSYHFNHRDIRLVRIKLNDLSRYG
jgi:hypothetical protein